MRKSKILKIILFGIILTGFLFSTATATTEKVNWDDVYIVGIIEPYNKTEISGSLEISPLFVEKMEQLLSQANYKVIRISKEMIYREGYPVYHESQPDRELGEEQIQHIGEKYKLDVLITGNIFTYQKRRRAEFLHAKDFWKIFLEAHIYNGKTGKLLLKVPLTKDERITSDQNSPPIQKQIFDIDISAITELSQNILKTIGIKTRDTTPPVIDIRKPVDAQVLRSMVVLVLGEVTDNNKVYSLSINGEEKNILPQKTIRLYHPISYIHGSEKERIILSVIAKDIYGNTATRTIGLSWGKPLMGTITKIEGKDILINIGSQNGVTNGMTFMACNMETYIDPLTKQNMFNFIEVGPVYVTRLYPNKSVCTFLNPDKADRMKKGDIVR